MGDKARQLWQAVCLRFWHCCSHHEYALRLGRGTEGRYPVLPLRMQRAPTAAGPFGALIGNGAPRSRRPPGILGLAFAAPYAGTFAAVYLWYPGNYGARSALRLGNLNLLGDVAQNVLLEFFYSGPHSRLSRMHSNPQASQTAPASTHE